jgi:hypothetical protein
MAVSQQLLAMAKGGQPHVSQLGKRQVSKVTLAMTILIGQRKDFLGEPPIEQTKLLVVVHVL